MSGATSRSRGSLILRHKSVSTKVEGKQERKEESTNTGEKVGRRSSGGTKAEASPETHLRAR